MSFSYKWVDLLDLVKRQVKNIPTNTVDLIQCDWVSARVAQRLHWKQLQQTIGDGQIPLVDGCQDYDPPFQIWRLDSARLTCTSTTTQQDVELVIRDSNAVDMYRRSPYAITSVALQAGAGRLRLSSAVVIPAGQTWELRGDYQINTKVTSLEQNLWFDDRYINVAIDGLKYVYMVLADDPRAGSTSGTWPGDITYTGQLAQWMSGIKEMSDAEDIGGDMQTMPDAPLGISSSQYGAMVAGYGFGGGNGGAQCCGIVSLNNDTTPAQNLVAGPGIMITSVGIGYTMISMVGALPAPTPPTVTAVSPSNGPLAGGTAVTITGTDFSYYGAIPTVTFGSAAATNVVVMNSTTITCVTPPGAAAGPVNVSVTISGETGTLIDGFSYSYLALTGLSLNPSAVVGGQGSVGTITLTGPAPTGGTLVNLQTNDPSVVTLPPSVTVPAGTNAATFTIGTTPVATAVQVTISASYAGGPQLNDTLMVNPSAPTQVSIYGGMGYAGATGISVSGNQEVSLVPSGQPLTILQHTSETVGQSFGPFSPNGLHIYLLLAGGSRTFVDQNGNTFAMNPPITTTETGQTMYLYGSAQGLYMTWTIKVAS